jgi:hypothetical protein
MRTQNLEKRVEALEIRRSSIPIEGWPPEDCDPARRLARYASYFDGRPWECTGTAERRAQRDANMACYQDYFDALEVER